MINEIITEVNAAKEEYQTKAREAIGKVFKLFMEQNPEVKRIVWTQYTPWFNDGETCVFSINDPMFVAKEPENAEDMSYYEWEEDDLIWSTGKYKTESAHPASDALEANINKLTTFMNDNETMLQEVLGDHVAVTILADGTTLIDEYEHD